MEINLTPVQAISTGIQLAVLAKDNRAELIVTLSVQMDTALKIYDSSAAPEAIAFTASTIIDEFSMLKIEEILVAFKRGSSLRYGKIYGKLSLPTFFEWIRAYIAEVNGENGEVVLSREKEHHNRKFDARKDNAEVVLGLGNRFPDLKIKPSDSRAGKLISINEVLTDKTYPEFQKKMLEMGEEVKNAEEEQKIEWKKEAKENSKKKAR